MKVAIQICHEFAVMWAQQAMGGDRSGASDHKEAAAREIIEELRKVNATDPAPIASASEAVPVLTDEQIAALEVAADDLIERYAAPIRAILSNVAHPAAAQPSRAEVLTDDQRKLIAEASTLMEMQADHDENLGIYEPAAVLRDMAARLSTLLSGSES